MRTPPAPIDVTIPFPELAGLARRTVRLHPRRGPEPGRGESKVGGTLLWPAHEPWPSCPVGQVDPATGLVRDAALLRDETQRRGAPGPYNSGPAGQPHGPYVGVLQVRAADVPELVFPAGRDLFQLLWCPRDHLPRYCPDCRVYWRRAADVAAPLGAPPVPAVAEEMYVPRICALSPERVREYPEIRDLPDQLRERIWAWEETDAARGYSYQYHLSVAPGTKVGGYVSWTQERDVPACPSCAREMDHLLTVASWEWDGETRRTWKPEEEKRPPADEDAGGGGPTGLTLGDANELYVFICRRCPDWPIAWVHQSS